ncbi:unnamed protein product [Rotaria sp. Silwood2]|nr:unnamed protein product [Rotaria sp. Silwood2]CAF4519550.1 unnamed protein product [Rotaria sp. Silwood2]
MSQLPAQPKAGYVDSNRMFESNSPHGELFIQSSQLSANAMTTASTTGEYNEKELSQQLRTTDVTVNLFDCMQCYVKIPRCKIEDHIPNFNPNVQTNLDHAVQEHQKEKEIASEIQTKQTTSDAAEQEEAEFYDPLNYLDDYNPMNCMIIIDLPWPAGIE